MGLRVAGFFKRRVAKFGLLLCAQLLAVLVFVVLSRAESGRPKGTRDVTIASARTPRKLAIVFVDSLSERVAQDPSLMPELGALAKTGVAMQVTPCRDQLTYLCLRALLTGYDESSLLALRGNFTHAASVSDNLLDRLAEAGRRVTVVGSHDFEPYQASLFRAKFGPGNAASEAQLFTDLAALDPERKADITLFSLSNGDRMAHGFGAASPQYRQAFQTIDTLIGQVVQWAGPDSDVLVFGDHGHDEMGRHLPGLKSTTYAVYAGPSFRRNVQLRATLTDHRAILGVLLGVPTPPSYTGPPFAELFAPGLLHQTSDLSALRAPAARSGSPSVRFVLAAWVLLAALWAGRKTLEFAGLARRWASLAAGGGAVLMALAGSQYDVVRHHIHDHGSEPLRSLYLLVPLSLGFLLAFLRHRGALGLERTLERGALTTVLLSFCLLFPTAYYYGASRGSVLAAIIAVLTVFAMRVHTLPSAKQRVLGALLALAIGVCLWSLYGLRGVGGETREMAYFVFSSPFFERYAWFTLAAVKVALICCFALSAERSRRDLAWAVLLGVAALSLEYLALPGAHWLIFPAALAYLWLRFTPDCRLTSARFFVGVIALDQFYGNDPLHIAPLQVIALCLLLSLHFWRLFFPAEPEARATATGLGLALAGYFLLWPTLGMRFSGIDFRFMFEWVPLARYEELWWLIGLGMLCKFVWPYALLADLARNASLGRARVWLCVAFALKLLALSVFAAWYATSHGLLTNGALEILAELALLGGVSVFAWPTPLRALHSVAGVATGLAASSRRSRAAQRYARR